MTNRKPGLPICEHVTLGEQLQQMHDQLVEASVKLGNAYPKSSPVATEAKRALDAVNKLRSLLDGVSSNEHSDRDGWATTIYYGANQEKQAAEVPPILERHRAGNPPCCTQPAEG